MSYPKHTWISPYKGIWLWNDLLKTKRFNGLVQFGLTFFDYNYVLVRPFTNRRLKEGWRIPYSAGRYLFVVCLNYINSIFEIVCSVAYSKSFLQSALIAHPFFPKYTWIQPTDTSFRGSKWLILYILLYGNLPITIKPLPKKLFNRPNWWPKYLSLEVRR